MTEKEQITLRLPADVKEVIKNEARKRGISGIPIRKWKLKCMRR